MDNTATTNDVTGDAIKSRSSSDSYRNNYDLIFGKKQSVNNNDTSETKNNTEK